MMLNIFSGICWPSICLLWRNVYLCLPLIFGLGFFLFIISCLYIWRLILCQLFYLQLFYPVLRLVISSLVSFALQKLLSQIWSHWFIFIFITLRGLSKRTLLWFMAMSILSMFSSKSFTVSGLTFKYLIHFEFLFMYGIKK